MTNTTNPQGNKGGKSYQWGETYQSMAGAGGKIDKEYVGG